MKISYNFPPNIEEIVKLLPEARNPRVIFTYGDTIYNPGYGQITDDLHVHEAVHEKQQGPTPNAWWRLYLQDPTFRLGQEIEAYRTQYAWALKNLPRQGRRALLKRIVKDISSAIYGRMVTQTEAEQLIVSGQEAPAGASPVPAGAPPA